jgi:hypothetical protein
MEANGQLHAQAALQPGKSPRYQLDKRFDAPQNLPGHCREKISYPLWESNPSLPSRSYINWAIREHNILLIYWSAICLMALSATQTIYSAEWLHDNEQWIKKNIEETIIGWFKELSIKFLEGPRKAMKTLSHNRWRPFRDSNGTLAEHKTEASSLEWLAL